MYRFCQAERAFMLSMFRDDSTRKQTQNRKPSAMRPTPKGCGFYGLFDNTVVSLFPHILPRHHRRSCRHTNRPIGITLTKHHPFRPQTIQMWCFDHWMPRAPHRIAAMLIRIYKNDIGF